PEVGCSSHPGVAIRPPCVDPVARTALMRAMLSGLSPLARDARAWPFEQARNLLARLLKTRLDTDAERDLAATLIRKDKIDEALATFPALAREVIFETGYGPSGLPHIGT